MQKFRLQINLIFIGKIGKKSVNLLFKFLDILENPNFRNLFVNSKNVMLNLHIFRMHKLV